MQFRDDVGCVIGCSLGTADYLGQMAAPDYPDELEFLYHEFREADEFTQIPIARRLFKSASDLVERTPDFWRNVVRRKLELEFAGMYRFLADPFPLGQNPYVEAVEKNIATITRRVARVAAVATNGSEELARGRPG